MSNIPKEKPSWTHREKSLAAALVILLAVGAFAAPFLWPRKVTSSPPSPEGGDIVIYNNITITIVNPPPRDDDGDDTGGPLPFHWSGWKGWCHGNGNHFGILKKVLALNFTVPGCA